MNQPEKFESRHSQDAREVLTTSLHSIPCRGYWSSEDGVEGAVGEKEE